MTGTAPDLGERVAVRAVKGIVDWLRNGSVEEVLLGMADARMLDGATLQRLARRIAQAKNDEAEEDAAEAGEETRQEGARK
jgi:hypothetical protein